jgi:hypothetical protein
MNGERREENMIGRESRYSNNNTTNNNKQQTGI